MGIGQSTSAPWQWNGEERPSPLIVSQQVWTLPQGNRTSTFSTPPLPWLWGGFIQHLFIGYTLNCSNELMNKNGSGTKKAKSAKAKKSLSKEERLRTPDKKFGGLTEEEVKKLLLPDHLAPNLDIIFVGINPGLVSAYKGHHYCNPTNHFWPLLYESGIYEIFSGGKCVVGRQPDINNTAVYVMPSTSGLVAQYPSRKDKLVFFNELRQLRDDMKRTSDIRTGSQTQWKVMQNLVRAWASSSGHKLLFVQIGVSLAENNWSIHECNCENACCGLIHGLLYLSSSVTVYLVSETWTIV